MSTDGDKRQVRDFIEAVWVRQDLDALSDYWTDTCVNHAAAPGDEVGLIALRRYHEQFAAQFEGFTDVAVEVVQQVAESDTVATRLLTRAEHSGRPVSLQTIRLDRFEDGRIAEHWSVADLAGLAQQMQS